MSLSKQSAGAVVAAVLMLVTLALPAGADTGLIQTFEDPTWDEDPTIPIADAIAALREVHPYLTDVRSLDMTRTRRVPGYSRHGLEVVVPPGGYRGFGPYARLPQPVDEAWFRYNIRLLDFRPVSSGKLPGLADASLTPSAKGCNPSTESSPGWSARLMFDTVGTGVAAPGEVPIGVYLYHLGQAGGCGDELMFNTALQQARWTCIEGHVRMNTPGNSDGLFEAWVDGHAALTVPDVAFRRAGETGVKIREMWNNVYFGGSYPTPNRLSLVLDDMVVSGTGRVGCIDPFVDDNDSEHEAALTELYARGLLYGCAERQACPHNALTRAEFAAMVHRITGGVPGGDAFVDDSGHWGEGVLNSLAADGVIRGCNPPANSRVCPDMSVSRAEVAAMVKRALGLPPGPDAFSDDNGHWAEGDINALAAAGITRGCGTNRYCPDRTMTRAEAATFMVRVDDGFEALIPLADLPEWPPPGPPPDIPWEERE